MLKFRELNKNEIEVRVAQIGNGWAQLLLYKDARVDMSILDETVGPENWKRRHYECKGNLFCEVSINTNYENPEAGDRWVTKDDCGAESNTEKEKGESSDSFKRACTNWGIGRELYTRIPIFVNVETEKMENGRSYKMKDRNPGFYVSDIKIDKAKNKITYVQIMNKNNQKLFEWKDKDAEDAKYAESPAKVEIPAKKEEPKEQQPLKTTVAETLKKVEKNEPQQVGRFEQIPDGLYTVAIEELSPTKTKSGLDAVRCKMRITSGELAGKPLFHLFTISHSFALHKFHDFVDACGYSGTISGLTKDETIAELPKIEKDITDSLIYSVDYFTNEKNFKELEIVGVDAAE